MTSSDKSWTIVLTVLIVAIFLTTMSGIAFASINGRAKFEAAVNAGLEQQQREGTTQWFWAHPKDAK